MVRHFLLYFVFNRFLQYHSHGCGYLNEIISIELSWYWYDGFECPLYTTLRCGILYICPPFSVAFSFKYFTKVALSALTMLM